MTTLVGFEGEMSAPVNHVLVLDELLEALLLLFVQFAIAETNTVLLLQEVQLRAKGQHCRLSFVA